MSADTEASKLSRRPRPEVHIYRPGSGPLRKSCSNVENIKPMTDPVPAPSPQKSNDSPSIHHTDVNTGTSDRRRKSEDRMDRTKSVKAGSSGKTGAPKQKSQPGRFQSESKKPANNDKPDQRSNNSPNTKTVDLREKLLEKQHQKTSHLTSNTKHDRNVDPPSVDRNRTPNFSEEKVRNGNEKKSAKRRNGRQRLDSARSEGYSIPSTIPSNTPSTSATPTTDAVASIACEKLKSPSQKIEEPISERRNKETKKDRKDGESIWKYFPLILLSNFIDFTRKCT